MNENSSDPDIRRRVTLIQTAIHVSAMGAFTAIKQSRCRVTRYQVSGVTEIVHVTAFGVGSDVSDSVKDQFSMISGVFYFRPPYKREVLNTIFE